jgi:hypothetical protein
LPNAIGLFQRAVGEFAEPVLWWFVRVRRGEVYAGSELVRDWLFLVGPQYLLLLRDSFRVVQRNQGKRAQRHDQHKRNAMRRASLGIEEFHDFRLAHAESMQ